MLGGSDGQISGNASENEEPIRCHTNRKQQRITTKFVAGRKNGVESRQPSRIPNGQAKRPACCGLIFLAARATRRSSQFPGTPFSKSLTSPTLRWSTRKRRPTVRPARSANL